MDVNALRERELSYANSVFLHERYFENLGGDGKPVGDFSKALVTQFGSAETLVRATAMSLGGGSGWVVISHSTHTNDLRIVGTGGHSQALASGTPILVLDMFEHAYALDYGAAAKYLDAFIANLSWAALDKRQSLHAQNDVQRENLFDDARLTGRTDFGATDRVTFLLGPTNQGTLS